MDEMKRYAKGYKDIITAGQIKQMKDIQDKMKKLEVENGRKQR